MFKRETAEQNLDKILGESEQQTKALNGLATSLTEKISAEFNSILIPKIDSINNNFENLPKNISSSIYESLEKPLQSISDTVTNITSNQVEQSTQVIETIIQKFIEKIDNITGEQGEILKDSALQSQKVLENTSNHLDDTFKTIKEILQSQQNTAELRDKKIIEDLEIMKTFQIGTLKHVVNNVNSNLKNLSSNIAENMNTVNNHVGQNLEKLVTSIEKVSEEQATNAFEREEMVAKKITKLMDALANSTTKQLESDKQRDEYRDKKNIADLENMKNFQNEMIGDILSNVNSNIETLSSKVGDNISNINNHMSTNLQQLVTYMQKIGEEQATNAFEREEMVAKKITKLMDALANSTTKQLESDKQRDEYIQNMIKNLENLVANLKNEITTIDDIFSKTSQKLLFIPAQIDKFSFSIDKLNNFENSQTQTTEQLSKFGNKLDSTTDNLVSMIDNLHSYNQSFNETNKEFNETISNTKKLFITMNRDFANLSEENKKIVDNFSRNTERALNEYHKSVEEAIKSRVIPQLDKALSGYASTMAEAISSLSVAIDELREDKNGQ
jgi:ABC-type transporter Mla subunit MlaD